MRNYVEAGDDIFPSKIARPLVTGERANGRKNAGTSRPAFVSLSCRPNCRRSSTVTQRHDTFEKPGQRDRELNAFSSFQPRDYDLVLALAFRSHSRFLPDSPTLIHCVSLSLSLDRMDFGRMKSSDLDFLRNVHRDAQSDEPTRADSFQIAIDLSGFFADFGNPGCGQLASPARQRMVGALLGIITASSLALRSDIAT